MDPRYLLDTNICIYIRRNRPEEVLRRFRKLRPGEAVLSVITYGELLYGATKSSQRAGALSRLQDSSICCPRFLSRKRLPSPMGQSVPSWNRRER